MSSERVGGAGRSEEAVVGGGVGRGLGGDRKGVEDLKTSWRQTPQDWTHSSSESLGLGRSWGLQTDFNQETLCSGEIFHGNPLPHRTMWVDLQTFC